MPIYRMPPRIRALFEAYFSIQLSGKFHHLPHISCLVVCCLYRRRISCMFPVQLLCLVNSISPRQMLSTHLHPVCLNIQSNPACRRLLPIVSSFLSMRILMYHVSLLLRVDLLPCKVRLVVFVLFLLNHLVFLLFLFPFRIF